MHTSLTMQALKHTPLLPEEWDRKMEAPEVGKRCERRLPHSYHLRKTGCVCGGGGHIFLNIRKERSKTFSKSML